MIKRPGKIVWNGARTGPMRCRYERFPLPEGRSPSETQELTGSYLVQRLIITQKSQAVRYRTIRPLARFGRPECRLRFRGMFFLNREKAKRSCGSKAAGEVGQRVGSGLTVCLGRNVEV